MAAAVALAAAGCGDEPERPASAHRTAQPSPTATYTPPPPKKLPKLDGLKPFRTGVKIDHMGRVAVFLRREAVRFFRKKGQPSKMKKVACDRVVEETLTIACFLLTKDGCSDYLIAWATEEERRVVGYKGFATLTCAERAQGLERDQDFALARLAHFRTGAPVKRTQRELKREIERRCAAGSDPTIPGEPAMDAVFKRIAQRNR